MTVASRKGILTKAVTGLKETVAAYTASIAELHEKIHEKQPHDNATFLHLGRDKLPVYIDGAALFDALITLYCNGAKGIIVNRERVEKAIASLRAEFLIDGREPITYPDDVQLAEAAARAVIDEVEIIGSEWETYAALVSRWLTPSQNPAKDSAQCANQTVNHVEDSQTAAADPLSQILLSLRSLQMDMSAFQSRMDRLENISRTNLAADNYSVAREDDVNSFIYSTVSRHSLECTPHQINRQQSQAHMVPISHSSTAQPHVMQPCIPQSFDTVQPQLMQQYPSHHTTPLIHNNNGQQTQLYAEQSRATAMPLYRTELPPLKLKNFDGTKSRYPEFKTIFDLAMGNQHIPPVRKLLYLRELLPQEDSIATSHFELTDTGYDELWQYLDLKYGDMQSMAQELRNKLRHLTASSSSIQSNKQLWLEAQAIANQLHRMQKLEPTSLIEDLMIKFTNESMTEHILAAFPEGTCEDWKLFVSQVNLIVQDLEKKDNTRKQMAERLSMTGISTSKTPSTIHSPAPRQKTYSCIYCNAVEHSSSECTVVPLEERKRFLRNNGRCENCAGKGHTLDRCTSIVTCLKCNGRHHRSLPCPEHQDLVHMNIVQCTKPKSTGCGRPGGKKPRHDKPLGCPILHTLPVLHGKIAGLDESIPILLDSGAQLSLIEESLAKKLRLPTHTSSTTLHLRGFQSDVTTAKSHVVSIELSGPSNFTLSVNVCTMKNMLIPVSVTEPTNNDKKFLRHHGLELPQSFPAKTVQPLIIIGMDILWQVLDGLKVTNLPSGKCHFITKLGAVITGPTMSIAQNSVVGQYHFVVAQEQVKRPTRDSEFSKMRDNYHIAVNTVQELRQFSKFAKSLYPDLFDKYKMYKENEETSETCNTLKSSVEKRPPGASLESGRVCNADTINPVSASQATGNNKLCLNHNVRKIHHGKYHHSSQLRKKTQRLKNLPEKMSQSCAEVDTLLPHTIYDGYIFNRTFTNTAYRRSPQPSNTTYHGNNEVTTRTHRTTTRHTQPAQSNHMFRSPLPTKQEWILTSTNSPRRKGRIRDDDGDPRR